jgi:hypothetical protein
MALLYNRRRMASKRFWSTSSMTAFCRSLAYRKRDTSRLLSRSVASRSSTI